MFKRIITLVAVLTIASLVLVACQPGGEGLGEGISPKHGGILKNAYLPITGMDPAFLASAADDHAVRPWNDYFIYINDADGQPDFDLGVALDYEVDEKGLTYTFDVRQGVVFHDKKKMTSRDIKFTFDRLRDPEIGAPTVEMYSNIKEITTPDDYTVVFELKETNPDFLLDLGDYHAVIMDADNTDFATNFNGTGPFVVESFVPEDRITYVRNEDYWMTDDDGYPLPYLDGLEFLFMGDSAAQIEALRGGRVNYLNEPAITQLALLEEDPNISIYSALSNRHPAIRMRADRPPADDVRVRQALRAGTDRAAILEVAGEGCGVTGRDTPVGPAFGDYYLDVPEFERDVEKAKELLAEAGYAEGELEITLHSEESSPCKEIATVWKEQMDQIGVNVNIQLLPSDVWFADMWLEEDFGITIWAPRPSPQAYLDLCYTSGALWHDTHWHDDELNALAAKTSVELDSDKRVQQFHDIQEIFMERGPVIIPYFIKHVSVFHKSVKGVTPPISPARVDLRRVYIEE